VPTDAGGHRATSPPLNPFIDDFSEDERWTRLFKVFRAYNDFKADEGSSALEDMHKASSRFPLERCMDTLRYHWVLTKPSVEGKCVEKDAGLVTDVVGVADVAGAPDAGKGEVADVGGVTDEGGLADGGGLVDWGGMVDAGGMADVDTGGDAYVRGVDGSVCVGEVEQPLL